MPTLNDIDYEELHEGSGVAEMGDDPTATRVLKCAWADAPFLVRALRGYTTIEAGELVIYPAVPHPLYTDLYPDTVSIKPMGKPQGENTWLNAKLTVNYAVPEEGNLSGTDPADLYSERLRAAYDVIEIEGPAVEHNGEAGTRAERHTITIPNIAYDLTIHRVPVLPFQKIIDFMGVDSKPKVNSTTFKGAAPGHMLFLSADADRKTTTAGVEDWTVTYHFLWSPVDHRKKFNTKTGSYDDVTIKATGDPLYDAANFNALFY